MVLIVRGLLRRPSLSVTFYSVHIHNVVAKKRDSSTDLLRRFHKHMQQHNVDFIGGDFNMSAFSTVGDVFADPEFSVPGNSWKRRIVSAHHAKRPFEWRVDSHDCYKFNNADLALLLTFPSSFTALTRSEQAQQRRLNVQPPGTSDGKGDVDERDVVHQDHVSAYLSHIFCGHQ